MNYIYYNMTRRIGLALVACMLPLAMFSQSGPELLRVNPDARSAAMGDASLGRAERMYIYTNPSAIFSTDCRLDASVSFMGHAKFQGVDGRQWGTAAGLAGKVGCRHALFAGFRYVGGLKLEAFSEQHLDRHYTIRPQDYTIDLGYAYSFTPHWAAHAVLSYVNSQIGQMGETVAATVGVSRVDKFKAGGRPCFAHTTLRLANIGPKLTYGQSTDVNLPLELALGTELTTLLSGSWEAALAVGARHAFKAGQVRATTDVNLGAEALYKQWALRAGTVLRTDDSPSMLTAGLGYEWRGFEMTAAWQMAARKTDAGDRFARLLLGFRYSL